MSSDIDRLRRLVGLRKQRRRSDPNLPDPDPPDPTAPQTGGESLHALGGIPLDAGAEEIAPDWPETESSSAPTPLHRLVPGREVATGAGSCFVSTHAYALDTLRGDQPLGSLLPLPPAVFDAFHPAFQLGGQQSYRHAVFLDTETTGLGMGAGVYCFMVGVGTFESLSPGAAAPNAALDAALATHPEPSNRSNQAGAGRTSLDALQAAPTHFVVRQYFMRNPAEERALLTALDAHLAGYTMAVTFNGRSFDLPLLRTRYRQNRRFLPHLTQDAGLLAPEQPHLDLLLPARRLWRRRLQSCRLINLEQMILGLQRSEEDVPGHLIPQLYTDYVQTGRAEAMRRVFYHNLEDIVTMVGLAAQLTCAFGEITPKPPPTASAAHAQPAQAVREPDPNASPDPATAALHGLDWASLAQSHERAGQLPQAEQGYRRALQRVQAAHHRADLYARLGRLLKRQARWEEAAGVWEEWLTSVPGANPEPYVELAKLYEWQLRDLEQAEMWTAWALHNVENAHAASQHRAQAGALRHRLARLRRKRAGEPPA